MVIAHAKVELAFNALGNLRNAVEKFRDCQHSVIFQMTNPSLHRKYEFKECGDHLEAARVCLKAAMEEAESAQAGLNE